MERRHGVHTTARCTRDDKRPALPKQPAAPPKEQVSQDEAERQLEDCMRRSETAEEGVPESVASLPVSSPRHSSQVLMTQNAGMAVSDGACSLDDDLATTTTEDGSLDPILKQLEVEKRRMTELGHGNIRPPVPLAEPEEEFLDDDTANNTDADVPNVPTSENVTPSDEVFLDSGDDPPEMAPPPEELEYDHEVAIDIDHMSTVMSNGLARSQKWQDFRIAELESLDWQNDIETVEDPNAEYDILEFAEKYYNVQIANTGYTGAISKTVNMVRRRSLTEVIPMSELLQYTKTSTITQSHVHLHDPENVTIACSVFKDICKYMKGELTEDMAHNAIRSMIAYGIERVELRDEMYCQLLRQTNGCRHVEYTIRAWLIMALCATSFNPSRTLLKYVLCYLRHSCNASEPKISRYATRCLHYFSLPRTAMRRMPPTVLEIEAMQTMSPIVCRVHFLDGQMRGIGIELSDTAADTLRKIQEKIDLQSLYGWALYESTNDHDRYIREEEYVADIISGWEEKQRANTLPCSPRKAVPRVGAQVHAYGKLVFCKRIFQPILKVPRDPVEYHLLYAQALHHNVQVDEYSISGPVALQLAGLQSQIIHGDYDEAKVNRYDDEEDYLCQRILESEHLDWRSEIANAHKKYGSGKSEIEAKISYVALISHFPLYGCIKFFAHYRGFWQYGIEVILAIGPLDIKFGSLQEKSIVCEYKYTDIELILVDINENLLTIQLENGIPSQQQCYMFECLDLEDLAYLLQSYTPKHNTAEQVRKQVESQFWKPSASDWLKMNDDILAARRHLVTSGVVQRPPEQGLGLIKSALKKLSGRACGTDRAEEEVDVKSPYWAYCKLPFRTSLMAFETYEMEDYSMRMFNSTLVYTGLKSVALLEDIDLVGLVQTFITKCMKSDDICNEFYLQLIKQTTDTPPDTSSSTKSRAGKEAYPNNRAALRYWHLLAVASCVMLPPNQLIVHYLNLHLRCHALLTHTEEGRYAQFCLKSLYRTYANKGRKHPPSYKEVVCITKWNNLGPDILETTKPMEWSRVHPGRSQPIGVLLHLPDGQQIPVEYDSVSTAAEVMLQVKARIGMRLDADGYGIFESCGGVGGWEQYIQPEDKLADCLYQWEQSAQTNTSSTTDLRCIFKKRIFVAPFMNVCDPVEVDLLYNQSVTDVFEGKIHVTKADAIRLCALRAQTEYGDDFDYTSVMRILPRHLRELINIADVQTVHKTLNGLSPVAANIAFLDVLKHWPLYGASFFEVKQSNTDMLPRVVWMAVSQLGVHLMEHGGQTVYSTFTYREIIHCTPTLESVIIMLTSPHSPKLVFSTAVASEIVGLINDYKKIILCRSDSRNESDLPSKDSLSSNSRELLASVEVEETQL